MKLYTDLTNITVNNFDFLMLYNHICVNMDVINFLVRKFNVQHLIQYLRF